MKELILISILYTFVYAEVETRVYYKEDQHVMIVLNVAANFVYAGMRAQNNPNKIWRIITFIFGFPFTIITYFAVKENSERIYGIDLLKNKSNIDNTDN